MSIPLSPARPHQCQPRDQQAERAAQKQEQPEPACLHVRPPPPPPRLLVRRQHLRGGDCPVRTLQASAVPLLRQAGSAEKPESRHGSKDGWASRCRRRCHHHRPRHRRLRLLHRGEGALLRENQNKPQRQPGQQLQGAEEQARHLQAQESQWRLWPLWPLGRKEGRREGQLAQMRLQRHPPLLLLA